MTYFYPGISQQECNRLCDALEFGSWDEDYYDYQKLIEFIARQPDESIKEALLDAFYTRVTKYEITNLDLSSLINQIPELSLDCLLHLIDIMGCTRSKDYLEFLINFKHPSKEVQESVQYSIDTIKYQLKENGIRTNF